MARCMALVLSAVALLLLGGAAAQQSEIFNPFLPGLPNAEIPTSSAGFEYNTGDSVFPGYSCDYNPWNSLFKATSLTFNGTNQASTDAGGTYCVHIGRNPQTCPPTKMAWVNGIYQRIDNVCCTTDIYKMDLWTNLRCRTAVSSATQYINGVAKRLTLNNQGFPAGSNTDGSAIPTSYKVRMGTATIDGSSFTPGGSVQICFTINAADPECNNLNTLCDYNARDTTFPGSIPCAISLVKNHPSGERCECCPDFSALSIAVRPQSFAPPPPPSPLPPP
eukprot:CAMPEP_0119106452 /NCGR_PEP_ID=MMETSP1180-20130426/4344_1 /TAXON_ID=3052 ORGANISM="Chlamydomonas cf sp, Strain CCMP681" /NCGR_SAMPLE_ID=MMETSP1180 /ASSEMBLY_ACC=CAM_ASM_000741 /LENGTH=276 /DNA_ID=CAMNT_0007091785 /DNA_START=64 /DNA_END=891 /DNA_ORIENTATION=-